MEWYLSGKFSGFYSNLESKPPGSLKWSKTGFLIVLLPFRFIFCIDAFYEVAFSEWKKWSQKAWGSCMQLPQSWGLWWVFLSLCSGETLASWGSSHQGGLSSSHQGQAWRSPETGKRCRCTQFARPAQKRRNFSCHSLALICQGNVIRVCLVLKYKLERIHKCEISLEGKLFKDFVQTCTWDLEYQKNKWFCSFVGSLETVYPFWISDYRKTL